MRRNVRILSLVAPALLLAACSSAVSDDASSTGEQSTVNPYPPPCATTTLGCMPLPLPKPKVRGDVDGDGRADIALTGGAGWGTIPVAVSQGTGYFQYVNEPVTGDTSFPSYTAQGPRIASGDFDGDGHADIAFAGGTQPSGAPWGTIAVAFSRGTSYAAVNSAGGDNARITQYAQLPGTQMVSTDINGDHKDDLFMTNRSGPVVAISNGDGTFRMSVTGTVSGSPNSSDIFSDTWAMQPGARLVAGDFNGDGIGDAALVGGLGWGSIPVAFGRANGQVYVTNIGGGDDATFAGWAAQPGATPVTGDFDGDGRTDIALAGGIGWTSVPVAFTNGDGSFHVTNKKIYYFGGWANHTTVTPQGTRGPWFVAGDYNGDGKADIALTGAGGWGTLPIAFSNGDGSFGSLTVPYNEPIATFPGLAAGGAVTALSASGAPVQTGCDGVSKVSFQRVPGSKLQVTVSTNEPAELSVGALRWSFASYPDSASQLWFQGGASIATTLPNVKNGQEYWLQVGPTPQPSSNGLISCGPAVIDVPANACGGVGQPCCGDTDCNGSGLLCQPAASSNADPTCIACGGGGEPACPGNVCNSGYTVDPSTGACTPCGAYGQLACNGNTCTQPYTWSQGGKCTWSCGENGEGCCDANYLGGWCRDGLACIFQLFGENTCGPQTSGGGACTRPANIEASITRLSCIQAEQAFDLDLTLTDATCGTASGQATVKLINSSNSVVWSSAVAAQATGLGWSQTYHFGVPGVPAGTYAAAISMTGVNETFVPVEVDVASDCSAAPIHASSEGATPGAAASRAR
jgi:hypothetical protein